MVDEKRKNNQLFLETIKEIYFDDLQVKNSMLPDLVWGEKIVEWLAEEVVLTENQHKLDQGLLTALSSINCSYLELYNANDFIHDRAGTKQLEEFVNTNKNDPDLQVVLNLRRGEGKRTVLEKMATRNISAVYLFLKAGADPNIQNEKGRVPLHYAAKYGNAQVVDVLLEENSTNINIQDEQKKTSLHYAVFHGHIDIINRLLEKEAIDINVQDNEGKIPLHYAASWGEEDKGMIEVLVRKGAKVNIQDYEYKTPLHYAADVNCSTKAVESLLKAVGADINTRDIYNRTPLYYAAEQDYEELTDFLLSKEAEVDIQDIDGNTPLHRAARRGEWNIVKLLIAKAKKINLKNKLGEIALHLALYSKDTRTPESILDRGDINFSICNKNGDTPLLLAAFLAQADILEKILKQGADINYVNSEGNSALHYAACNNYTGENCKTTKNDFLTSDNDPLDANSNDYSEDTAIKSVSILIAKGINVNVKNNRGNTPLFFAAEAKNFGVAKQLMEQGANVEEKDNNGYTALHYAVKARSFKMLGALLPCKIDEDGIETEAIDTKRAQEILPNIIDQEGNSLLHHAVKYGCSKEMLNFLVENGVDINGKNKNGVAPIHIAAKYGHEQLLDFFTENKADLNAQCGNFTKSEIEVTEKNFINVQDGSRDESSIIDVKNDAAYKEATPISIAVDNSYENVTGKLLSQGAKPNIKNNSGWTPIQIAIRTACDEKCTKKEREKAYGIIEKLALFSRLPKKAATNERVRKILEKALRDKESDNTPNAPVYEYAPSAPPLDDDFYDKIGSYVKDIPELYLYPDLSEEFKELEKSNMNIIPKDISANSIRFEGLDDDLKKITHNNQDKSKTDLGKECSKDNLTRDTVKLLKQKIEGISKIKSTSHDREKLNIFSDKVAKSKDIAELNQVVSEALKSGVRLNFLNNNNQSFTDVVMQRIQELKENSKIASNIIYKLVSKGAGINSYEKINQELEGVFKDHKTNIQKAYLEANKRINDFHEAVANATTGKIELIEVDNTTFYLECSADSTVDVAKAIEAARDTGLYDGNIAFGSNIVKIGESEVEIETKSGIRNYTDLSDNDDVIITFQTSLGKLDVRLYNNTQYEDFIQVEVCNPKRFNELIDIKEEIGKNCLFGGLSVYDAIEQGYFERSGKLQSSEVISQDVKKEAEEIIGRISSTDIGSSGDDTWANRIQGKRTNEGCGRGM